MARIRVLVSVRVRVRVEGYGFDLSVARLSHLENVSKLVT